MKKRKIKQLAAILFMMSVFSNVYAVGPGFYLGFMAGPATNNGGPRNIQVLPLPTCCPPPSGAFFCSNPPPLPPPCPIIPSPIANRALANPKSTQFGSRIFLGYKMNALAGFETGFIFFSGINYKLQNQNLTPAAGTTFRVRGIDLVGKLDYSIPNAYVALGALVKAGVMALYKTTPGALNITNCHSITLKSRNQCSIHNVQKGSNTYNFKFAPTFSLGASVDINQSWVVDLTYNYYAVGNPIGSMTFYALGLSYHFVDRYCGQFLCDD